MKKCLNSSNRSCHLKYFFQQNRRQVGADELAEGQDAGERGVRQGVPGLRRGHGQGAGGEAGGAQQRQHAARHQSKLFSIEMCLSTVKNSKILELHSLGKKKLENLEFEKIF